MHFSSRYFVAHALFLAVLAGGAACGPSAEAAHIEEMDLLIRNAHYKKAISVIDSALMKRPQDLDLLLRKGICLSMLECFEESRRVFEKGLIIDPKEPRFLHNLGLLCMREKKFDEAEAYLKKTLAVRAWHPEANFHLGVIYEGRGDVAKALEYYAEELNQNARCAKAWQRWHALKSTGRVDNGVSLVTVLLAATAMVAGLFVLYRKKKSDDEEIKCAS